MNGEHRYDDIIDLPPHVSERHPPLSRESYAAQFSPFAALTGYDGIVSETARSTTIRPEPDEYQLEEIRGRLDFLYDIEESHPPLTVSFFKSDPRKPGGEIVTLRGTLEKIDGIGHTLSLQDGTTLPLDDILDLSTPLLDK